MHKSLTGVPATHMQGFKPALAFKLIVASRLGIGMGEGVALPVMNSLIITLPRSLRSTGLGVAFTGFHSGEQYYYKHAAAHSGFHLSIHLCSLAIGLHTLQSADVLWLFRRELAGACNFSYDPRQIWMARAVLHFRHLGRAAVGFLAGCSTQQAL